MRRIAMLMVSLLALTLAVGARAQSRDALPVAAQDALLHVIAHEIGHAVLREFDLPILGPEEAIADDFATVYLHMMLPGRLPAIVAAHARHTMADDDVPGPFSEYRSDRRRAGRAVCLAYGLDPDRHAGLARDFGLGGAAAATCRDFATEVARGWRRTLAPYLMPPDARVTEVGMTVDDGDPMARAFADSPAHAEAERLLRAIDWHSRVTLALSQCDGSAGWSRGERRITVCGAYIARLARHFDL
ncbi:DUF4344 domain-containing metallopeptidase [Jannaschia sp. 2305UL9-9]|uniref:DUF4344 domain-containing metallopeptidase n=1 Tax=Jannaschia sp. 2305UL9-9 TaxID=3121638 RepID=UPI003526E9CB